MNLLEKIKWSVIRDNLIVPAASRVGTFVATLLVTYGATAPDAEKVGVGVGVFLCIMFDFVMHWMVRKIAERKGAEKATDPRTLAALAALESRLGGR